jgi:hypothetical protein
MQARKVMEMAGSKNRKYVKDEKKKRRKRKEKEMRLEAGVKKKRREQDADGREKKKKREKKRWGETDERSGECAGDAHHQRHAHYQNDSVKMKEKVAVRVARWWPITNDQTLVCPGGLVAAVGVVHMTLLWSDFRHNPYAQLFFKKYFYFHFIWTSKSFL